MSQLVDVGVDLGTTVTKAVALGLGGEVRARATIATQWDAPRPNWAQRDAGTVHDVVDQLLRDVVDRAGDVVVRSVGFASIAETGALVDRDGRAVSPLIAWHDPRGGLQAQARWHSAGRQRRCRRRAWTPRWRQPSLHARDSR